MNPPAAENLSHKIKGIQTSGLMYAHIIIVQVIKPDGYSEQLKQSWRDTGCME